MDHVRNPPAHRNAAVRQSLEVPDTPPSGSTEPTNGSTGVTSPLQNITNGVPEEKTITSATYMPGMGDGMNDIEINTPTEKRESIGRTIPSSRFSARKPVGVGRMSQDTTKRDSTSSDHHVGVTLEDKPMDD